MESSKVGKAKLTESEQRQSLRHGLRAVIGSLKTADVLLKKTPEQAQIQELLRLCQVSLNEMIERLYDAPATDSSIAESEAPPRSS